MLINKEGFIFYESKGDCWPSPQAVCGLRPPIQSHWAGAGMSSGDASSLQPLCVAEGWYQYWLFRIIARFMWNPTSSTPSALRFPCATLLLLDQFLVCRPPKWGYCSCGDKKAIRDWLCSGAGMYVTHEVCSLHSAAARREKVHVNFTARQCATKTHHTKGKHGTAVTGATVTD